ncbi:SpaH/EbpB family LPXTG-anchored major pilin [Lentibacillus saliphilus]|uniref:SpaH/EbpB family LPXTG-anchored major pilin n=1 Tax=Lentibacillus saliphilus TaxID=2737028 RepID=UPI001C2F5D27|nr:SpaH/EbpB family LPXTG-anchored major pilin [Lentibacillus saliphilus]
MKKRFSIYHVLVAVLLLSLMLPAAPVSANGDHNNDYNGSLTIHKYEREPGAEDGAPGDGTEGQEQDVPDDAVLLEGVTFKITQTHAFDPMTDEWTEVTDGAVFQEITDAYGEALFANLPLGRYKVEEIDGPDHVNLNPNDYYVDIPMTSQDGSEVNYNVHIYPKNEIIRGAVELTKFDGDTEGVLAGVKYELYNAADDTLVEMDGVTQFSTDANGKVRIDGLAYGDYYFKEVETLEGYVLGDQRIEFSITESGSFGPAPEFTHEGTVVVESAVNYKSPEIIKEVSEPEVNRGDIVTYTLTIDIPGDISDYNSFVVTDVLDDNLEFAGNEQSPDAFTFAENGQTLTWTVTDFSQLSGPGQVTLQFDAKVKEDAEVEIINNKAKIDFENEHEHEGEKETDDTPIELTDGGVKVIKVDASDHSIKLAGAEFKLTDADGNTIDATGTLIKVNGTLHDGLLENLVTDENGEITITGLNVGTYYLEETKAPTYEEDGEIKSYRLLNSPIEVEIVNNETAEYTVENSKSGWLLPKTGGIGTVLFTMVGLTLMGAALVLYIRRKRVQSV